MTDSSAEARFDCPAPACVSGAGHSSRHFWANSTCSILNLPGEKVKFSRIGAAGSLALAHPTELVSQTCWSVTVLVLLVCSVIAVYLRRSVGAFAGGFALVGFGFYLLSAFASEGLLVSDVAFSWMYAEVHGPPPTEPGYTTMLRSPDHADMVYHEIHGSFLTIGRCLTVLILGCLGGLLAVACRSRQTPK